MAILKRLFQAEKSSSADAADSDEARGPPTQAVNPLQRSMSLNTSRQLNADENFQSIEKQFKELHDQMQARPLSSRSHAPSSGVSSRFTQRNPRHVDLLDALFSSHRYQVQIANALSPTTPFNEDIAERNMVRFLQGQPRTKKVYSRIISALYQEDVADRNIAKNRTNKRTISRTASSRSQPASTSSGEVTQREVASQSLPRANGDKITPSGSRPGSSSSSQPRPLWTHRSTPNIMTECANASGEQSAPNDGGYLDIPPAHKQGDKWSNTPLPDSPTLPVPMTQGRKMGPSEEKGTLELARSSTSTRSNGSSTSPRLNSKRNVRDLSINTELAARGKPTSRISHRAIQPPTPSNYDIKQNPSIAEVMNSPLPLRTPTLMFPLPPSNQKAEVEVMGMFKQAFNSSAGSISPHPTFETLQDAIVREINSHEAFRRVPVPETGPLFTPSPSQDSFDRGEISAVRGVTRSFSTKERQFSKLIRRGSFKKHRRGSEHKSISTTAPATLFRRGSASSRRRRHTDAPPPSPGFLDVKQDGTLQDNDQPQEQEQVTYMDILFRAQKSPPNSRRRKSPEGVRGFGRTQSSGTLGSSSFSDRSQPTPSVYYMRAQTCSSSSDGRNSFSADDSDEEVIQLPSIATSCVQIQAVDKNNVTYMMENTTPRNAYRLMNWPHGTRRALSSRGSSVTGANKSAHHSPRHEHLIRSTRSVESY
ncbi:hypothetical protein IFM61606_05761 [Aspergillus udagawae]|uniref:Uncharacterized protein n=1 Tax=Aspergillus udagawae TaxID=91492 RepID=A0A8H3NJN9_9EURO|nr:uncharacterized protein Aud_001562 [Aspergillus udagawae]GFF33248.1 hypothetical protein IFM46972_03828 [Aspergillus udagawae]GFF42482.1 hypothetical protein IFM51744_05153 [Aspergillus udagawae]GFF79865.1 hypothetical protein IFM53868_02708 [Aspergillus udagawae]GFG05920.1 hypothetical protein IFM5058_02664 [Aspergillus udagawae]GFG25805.1 hypothetical protein IFM61606_05761 [Aspergillus udagawae]